MFHPLIDQTVDLMMGNEPAETSTILPPCQGAYCNLHMVQKIESQVGKPENIMYNNTPNKYFLHRSLVDFHLF